MSVAFCIVALAAAVCIVLENAFEGATFKPNYFPFAFVMIVTTMAAVVLRMYGA